MKAYHGPGSYNCFKSVDPIYQVPLALHMACCLANMNILIDCFSLTSGIMHAVYDCCKPNTG